MAHGYHSNNILTIGYIFRCHSPPFTERYVQVFHTLVTAQPTYQPPFKCHEKNPYDRNHHAIPIQPPTPTHSPISNGNFSGDPPDRYILSPPKLADPPAESESLPNVEPDLPKFRESSRSQDNKDDKNKYKSRNHQNKFIPDSKDAPISLKVSDVQFAKGYRGRGQWLGFGSFVDSDHMRYSEVLQPLGTFETIPVTLNTQNRSDAARLIDTMSGQLDGMQDPRDDVWNTVSEPDGYPNEISVAGQKNVSMHRIPRAIPPPRVFPQFMYNPADPQRVFWRQRQRIRSLMQRLENQRQPFSPFMGPDVIGDSTDLNGNPYKYSSSYEFPRVLGRRQNEPDFLSEKTKPPTPYKKKTVQTLPPAPTPNSYAEYGPPIPNDRVHLLPPLQNVKKLKEGYDTLVRNSPEVVVLPDRGEGWYMPSSPTPVPAGLPRDEPLEFSFKEKHREPENTFYHDQTTPNGANQLREVYVDQLGPGHQEVGDDAQRFPREEWDELSDSLTDRERSRPFEYGLSGRRRLHYKLNANLPIEPSSRKDWDGDDLNDVYSVSFLEMSSESSAEGSAMSADQRLLEYLVPSQVDWQKEQQDAVLTFQLLMNQTKPPTPSMQQQSQTLSANQTIHEEAKVQQQTSEPQLEQTQTKEVSPNVQRDQPPLQDETLSAQANQLLENGRAEKSMEAEQSSNQLEAPTSLKNASTVSRSTNLTLETKSVKVSLYTATL